jgi:hypothetical protein
MAALKGKKFSQVSKTHSDPRKASGFLNSVKVKQSHYRPLTGPEGSRRLRLPDFKTIGT